MTGSSGRVAVLDPPMAFGRPLLRQLEEAGYAIRSCTSAAEVESLAADALVDAALIVPPAGVAVSDAERARLARLCLSLPTLVALPQLDATLAGLRDLIARGHQTADASRDGLARSRSLTERSRTLLRKTRGRLEHRSGTDSRLTAADDGRLLSALERLIALATLDLPSALQRGAQVLGEVLEADWIGIFTLDAGGEYLVAAATSPLVNRRHPIFGPRRISIAAGGRAAEVFRTGRTYLHGDVSQDPGDAQGLAHDLGVGSSLIAPLLMDGKPRGVLIAWSATPHFFAARDRHFIGAVGRWLGVVFRLAIPGDGLAARDGEASAWRVSSADEGLLTTRQQEIAALIADGLSNAEIASRLVVTPGTVANHVAEILRRLGYRRRAQIARWAAEHPAAR